jgi:hypothetical protein
MRRFATMVLSIALVCFGSAGWLAFRAGDDGVVTDKPRSSGTYSDLRIQQDRIGWFEGSITVRNGEKYDRRIHVDVALYDGDQNVGELTGSAMLKPDSESSIELVSTDEFTDYDEARVDVWAP